MPALAELNAMDRAGFVAALGAVFEHSPWIADAAFAARPFADVAALHRAMVAAVDRAGEERQLALIRAHPDLAGKAARAGALGAHSTREQAGAGLDRLSDEEYARFHRLNDAYQARFGFPFIIAVRDHTKDTILRAFETRLGHDRASEIAEALRNVARIAELRLADLVR
jgi:2-oxo-4-hydroxy-4-carboxy-5-ureidoimidazoline decarboxylase